MSKNEIALMAHLQRRAGFGATREELEDYVAKGYEATLEELLHPEDAPPPLDDEDIIRRYHVGQSASFNLQSGQAYWLYRMINTKRPLEEKVALFWHGVFATGFSKLFAPRIILRQIEMFRRRGLGSFRNLLLELSRDPAMIFWLDNKDNHKGAVNENYGRELLELFSMGVGNYTEDDVRQASYAFTGWTMRDPAYHTIKAEQCSIWPYGKVDLQFRYEEDDHDGSEKAFLGETGAFNGEDIIEIVCRQPATARFIARHLYSFFVADEPPVPSWPTVPPSEPEAIGTLAEAFVQYEYDIRSVLRVLFNSEFFKRATFAKVKSPTEVVVGSARIAGSFRFPEVYDIEQLGIGGGNLGQSLLNPPSVEGWHTGSEWITTDSLVARVNFAARQFEDVEKPGVQSIVERIRAQGDRISPERLLDACLDLMGPLTVSVSTRQELLAHAMAVGEISFGTEHENRTSAEKVKDILQLIVATREYQLT